MSKEQLYDIHEVCRLLETTSRTLRFYEEKGLIQSSKSDRSSRRHYTPSQIEEIRHITILRALGLSIKAIKELQQNGTDLKNAVISRRAEIMAIIEEKYRKIHILNEALCLIDDGKSIFECPPIQSANQVPMELREIVQACTESIIHDDPGVLYSYLSETMKKYMPLSTYQACKQDTFAPLGSFIAFEKIESDPNYPNIIYHYVKYTKLGLKIKYVFHHQFIHGFWMGYYSIN